MAIDAVESIRSQGLTLLLSRLMRVFGKPRHTRSDNGAKFTAIRSMKWPWDNAIGSAYIQPDGGENRGRKKNGDSSTLRRKSPWGTTWNGHIPHWVIERLRKRAWNGGQTHAVIGIKWLLQVISVFEPAESLGVMDIRKEL